MKTSERFDVLKQLELDVFCDMMYGIARDVCMRTQDGLKAALQAEISEKTL